QADQARQRDGKTRYLFRNAAHRGPGKIKRFASRPRLRRRPRTDRSTVLCELRRTSFCSGGEIEGRRLRRISLAVSATRRQESIVAFFSLRTHNETLSVAAMRVCNLDCSPFAIQS